MTEISKLHKVLQLLTELYDQLTQARSQKFAMRAAVLEANGGRKFAFFAKIT